MIKFLEMNGFCEGLWPFRKPRNNVFAEPFLGDFWDECLNGEFLSLYMFLPIH